MRWRTAHIQRGTHAALGTLLGKWQLFMARRGEANFALLQEVAQSKSPEAAWSGYATFWQKLAADCRKEILTMRELARDATRNSAAAARSTAETAPANASSSRSP